MHHTNTYENDVCSCRLSNGIKIYMPYFILNIVDKVSTFEAQIVSSAKQRERKKYFYNTYFLLIRPPFPLLSLVTSAST